MDIHSQDPVGYRYTVYDSLDPVRIVLDFPGMDVSELDDSIQVDAPPLQEIRVSSLDLTSGKLGRIELLLAKVADYDIRLEGNHFQVVLASDSPLVENSRTAPPQDTDLSSGKALVKPAPESATVSPAPLASAGRIESVDMREGGASLLADGPIKSHRYFNLGAPPRLVVDVYGVEPVFKERAFSPSHGFSKIRVGTYKDKTRFVFDAENEELPDYAVNEEGNSIVVSWGGNAGKASMPPSPPPGVPMTVEAVDFRSEDGKSFLSVELSSPAELIETTSEGDIVRFGVKNANISRALRRSIDASVFPSAVKLVTPYTVLAENRQDVLFAVELKGPVPYTLRREGDMVLFVVEDGPFAEAAPAAVEKVSVLAPPPAQAAKQPSADIKAPAAPRPAVKGEPAEPVLSAAGIVEVEKKGVPYRGEKITLVFDDADIRRIFQLIGEVSDLNVLVGDEVKGTITLRLIDVPWDQALDLILDIKNLGMLKEGNVVRILPRDRIRSMRQAELTAVKEERELEPLVTEVISVSYTALGNIAGPAGELLTDRGKITPDNRNKQLIVTDIPSVIEEVKKLVAILDTPEKQVMIEARIVEARTNFTRDLGVSWNFSYDDDGVDDVSDLSNAGISGGGSFVINPTVGAAGLGSSFTFGQLGVSSSVLDLRLSAAETAGNSKVISKPRVSTLNGETAVISQGTQIPYQSISDQGTKTEFVDATLELNVTPIINPDNSIILEIKASNNTPTTVSGASAPGIDKKEATTKVLVKNGETTVIGGIFTENDSRSETGIPWLRKLPFIGYLFKSTNRSNDRSELLIFITPRILD
ncbi:type IV pilus secretin family protein [Desulfuromonas sp. TF]|uniref:type IV pilus secretin family protein n=1 Tax=Desulfuromonas sp. TF TaxID=1232410 RepID=UPI00138B04D8|nr:type IV pilus secretin family protein [Desulfuromonas sp. TF]